MGSYRRWSQIRGDSVLLSLWKEKSTVDCHSGWSNHGTGEGSRSTGDASA